MKKHIFNWITLCFVAVFAATSIVYAQNNVSSAYTVMFYNVENVFDTINSPGVLDEEFTPDGIKKWNSSRYWRKMSNLERVFYDIAATEKSYPAIIGVSEIENRNVLEDIAAMPKLLRANYQIVHYDSPDARGVDVAFFYRPDIFKYEGSEPLKVYVEEIPDFRTRDILSMWGKIDGEDFCFFVCHWPSRLGGQAASEFKRLAAAQTVRDAIDSISNLRPDTKFVVMGDMNDDPVNRSLSVVLAAKEKISNLQPGDMYNPFWQMHKAGFGSLAYNDVWNLFDNIVVSENLVNADKGHLKLYRKNPKKNPYYGYIFDRPYLRQTSGQYKGYPLRTFVGNNFQGGYSDHFPVYILISK